MSAASELAAGVSPRVAGRPPKPAGAGARPWSAPAAQTSRRGPRRACRRRRRPSSLSAAALGAALLQGEVSGPADAERASPCGAVAPAGVLPVSPEAQGLPQRHGAALSRPGAANLAGSYSTKLVPNPHANGNHRWVASLATARRPGAPPADGGRGQKSRFAAGRCPSASNNACAAKLASVHASRRRPRVRRHRPEPRLPQGARRCSPSALPPTRASTRRRSS